MDLAQVFLAPGNSTHRQYEALRAYFVDELPAREVARRFGYTVGSVYQLVHQFRRKPDRPFFVEPPTPGAKPSETVQQRIVELRKQNQSIYDISEALKKEGIRRSPMAVAGVVKQEGFARLPRRKDEERPAGTRPTAGDPSDARALSLEPRAIRTKFGGLFLFLPALAEMGFDRLIGKCNLPGTRMVPAAHAMRSLLALKLFGTQRHTHVMSAVLDEGLALFAGLNVIPKRSFLTEYSCRIAPLTTYANLDELNRQGVRFITLRRRGPQLVRTLFARPRGAWRRITLEGVSRIYRTPRILDERVTLAGYSGPIRQIAITELGHEQPTLLLTNQLRRSATKLIGRYARRMLIENNIEDGVNFFHMDALSSAVALKVNCDLQLTLMGSSLYRYLGQRIGNGYEAAKSRHLFRDFVDATASIGIDGRVITVQFQKRAHNPLLVAAGFDQIDTRIPWLGNRRLEFLFG